MTPAPLLLQTWPRTPPAGRSYTSMRRFARVPIDQHDATAVREVLLRTDAPGVLMVEWDIALELADLWRLICRAKAEPEAGFVAPYRLWPGPRWAHRIGDPARHVKEGDPLCDLPAFGCIYLPRDVLEGWSPAPHDPRLTDSNFANWARGEGIVWPILWDVRPVHLNY